MHTHTRADTPKETHTQDVAHHAQRFFLLPPQTTLSSALSGRQERVGRRGGDRGGSAGLAPPRPQRTLLAPPLRTATRYLPRSAVP
eukprot:999435-Rhodomonas_salina.4